MEKLEIKYRTTGKAIPPRPIRISTPGWAGGDVPKLDGNEPQPWHCPPFVEGSIYGLELVYPYDRECHVINDAGDIRFDWDFAAEPGIKLHGEEFAAFFPRPSRFYLFNTGLDMQAPPGHVLRTQPHPRFYTDETGTVPMSLMGHVQTEWFTRPIFCVFKVPPPGQRHIFRKDEAYAQILFVPHLTSYEPVLMTPQEQAQRLDLERAISSSAAFIAKNVWHNPAGHEFKDHYKLMGRAFAVDGAAGVGELVREAVGRLESVNAQSKTPAQGLQLAERYCKEGKYVEARAAYLQILARDGRNAEAVRGLAQVIELTGSPVVAAGLLKTAAGMQPRDPARHAQYGEILLRLNRFSEAQTAFRIALSLKPNDPDLQSRLSQAQRGTSESQSTPK
jgi:hypothetical protein